MASGGPVSVSVSEAKRVVDAVVRHLEQNFNGFKINEIIKAGSLGHGTTVPGKFDIDLVIYSDEIRCYKDFAQYQPYLEKLDDFLRETVRVETEMTARSIQFNYRGIDIDLLISPYWRNQHELYQFLQSVPKKDRDDFTVFASKWQVEFFERQPQQVKDYISRAKSWRNRVWSNSQLEGKPSSYLISLLVLKAYEKKGRGTVTDALKSIVLREVDICWEELYQRRDYPDLLPSRPRIVDPANPANNVWTNGFKRNRPNKLISDYEPGDGNAEPLRRYIHTLNLDDHPIQR